MKRINKIQYWINSVKCFLTGSPNIVVTVVRDEDAGLWVAFNDKIGLATEARSLEQLIEIVEKLVPELIEEEPKQVHFFKESNQALA